MHTKEHPIADSLVDLNKQNEYLKTKLLGMSLINELTGVLHTCSDISSLIKTVLFSIQEIGEFDRVIYFEIDRKTFSLAVHASVGLADQSAEKLSVPLGFEGGEITDAIFLNRHFVVEKPDATDLFVKAIQSPGYAVFPLTGRVSKRCCEVKNCGQTTCPAYSGYNPHCWTIQGASLDCPSTTEDERRKNCINCSCFKGDGVIWVDRHDSAKPITSDDISTLTTIVRLAEILLENFRTRMALDTANATLQNTNEQLSVVNNDLQIAQGRIQSDLEHAQEIQLGLLPQDLERSLPFPAAARYISADAVGGDYYDIFPISETTYGIVIADVSGHGIAASLIMSMAKVLLKSFAPQNISPMETLNLINDVFIRDVQSSHFITIFYAILDTKEKTVCYSSAGHCPVLCIDRTSGISTQIDADGVFMGIFPAMMLKETTVSYAENKLRFVLITDGLIEATNAATPRSVGRDQTSREHDSLVAKRHDLEQRAQLAGSEAVALRQQIQNERAAQEAARARLAAQTQAAKEAAAWDPVVTQTHASNVVG